MASNVYQFTTRWEVEGTTCQEISDVLSEAEDLARWWPSVYLDVKVTDPGGPKGIGKYVKLYTKGWLPYTLKWDFRITGNSEPHGFALEAIGDFNGTGVWTFEQQADKVIVVYDWRIKAEKGMLKTFSFLLKPIFSWNHHWAMKKGLESLRLELRRRHSKTDAERAQVPPPPRAKFAPKNKKIL